MPRERVVAYFRIGMDRRGRFEHGLDVQHMAIANHLHGGKRALAGIYTEIESGPRCDRPELARALETCRLLSATLIIARLDGLARDASVLLAIFDAAPDCEVVLCSPPEVARDRAGTTFVTLMARPAEPAPGPTTRRTRAACAMVRSCGKHPRWTGRPLQIQEHPTSRAGEANRRRADQRAADILPVIRAFQAAGANTLQSIADALNARAIRTARGGRWHPTTVRNLLRRNLPGARQVAGDPKYILGSIAGAHVPRVDFRAP
jgi:hypothetical protein